MAGTKDKTKLAAEKARKQKIIVGIGGALLLAVLVIQGPKLWKQINPPAAEPASSSAASQAADATSTTATTTLATSKSTAVLAGVSISTAARSSRVVTGKLVGFTLFNAKDPFVPHVTTTSSSNTPSPDTCVDTRQPADEHDVVVGSPGARRIRHNPDGGTAEAVVRHDRSQREGRDGHAEGHVPRRDPDVHTGRPDA